MSVHACSESRFSRQPRESGLPEPQSPSRSLRPALHRLASLSGGRPSGRCFSSSERGTSGEEIGTFEGRDAHKFSCKIPESQ